jgi:hypothetical protein
MNDPQDRLPFGIAMAQLSRALNTIELTKDHIDVYWKALSDLGIDGVLAACDHLARHFIPDYKERFPVPGTIREQVVAYRQEQRQVAQASALQQRALLPEAATVPDDEALANIRDIIAMLDEKMDMRNVQRDSAATRLDARRVELLAQSQMILAEEQARKEREHVD